MRSQTIRATAVEGVRTYTLESERVNPESMPAWRRRALYPEIEGVSLAWRTGKDMTGRLVVR